MVLLPATSKSEKRYSYPNDYRKIISKRHSPSSSPVDQRIPTKPPQIQQKPHWTNNIASKHMHSVESIIKSTQEKPINNIDSTIGNPLRQNLDRAVNVLLRLFPSFHENTIRSIIQQSSSDFLLATEMMLQLDQTRKERICNDTAQIQQFNYRLHASKQIDMQQLRNGEQSYCDVSSQMPVYHNSNIHFQNDSSRNFRFSFPSVQHDNPLVNRLPVENISNNEPLLFCSQQQQQLLFSPQKQYRASEEAQCYVLGQSSFQDDSGFPDSSDCCWNLIEVFSGMKRVIH